MIHKNLCALILRIKCILKRFLKLKETTVWTEAFNPYNVVCLNVSDQFDGKNEQCSFSCKS